MVKKKKLNYRKYTTESFIEIAKTIHGDKYDYSITEYINIHKKIKYICKKHGLIEQTPHNHIYNKHGCYKCGLDILKKSRRKTKEEFIEEVSALHGDKYDYSKVKYINNKTKVIVICDKHGEFEISPNNHLHLLQGCKNCKK